MNTDQCNDEVFKHGQSLGFFAMTKDEAEAYCKAETARSGHTHDWHYVAGRVHVKVLINPAIATCLDDADLSHL